MTEFKPTIIVAGGKGGVGKSTCTLALLYCMERCGMPLHLVETDTSNPDCAKAYQQPTGAGAEGLSTSLVNLDLEDGWLELLNLRVQHPDRVLVVNTGSRNSEGVQRFGPLLTEGLEELQAELVTLWMIDGSRDCLELLVQYRQTFPTSRVHVLRNAAKARSFDLFDSSKLRSELGTDAGLTFPALAERVAQALSANRLSFTAAERSELLPFADKIALRRWLTAVRTVLQPVTTWT